MQPDLTKQLLENLHDVDPPLAVSPFPLAEGWWWLIGLVLLIAALSTFLVWRRNKIRQSFCFTALKALEVFEVQVRGGDNMSAAEVSTLAETLKKAAILRYGRRQTAGLTGESWLAFMEGEDAGFHWKEHGKLLTRFAYAPAGKVAETEEALSLIYGAKRWIKKCGV